MKKQKNSRLLAMFSGWLIILGFILGAVFIVIGVNSDDIIHINLLIPISLLLAGVVLARLSGQKLKQIVTAAFETFTWWV